MTRALTDAEIATLLRAGHESFGPEALELLTRLVAQYQKMNRCLRLQNIKKRLMAEMRKDGKSLLYTIGGPVEDLLSKRKTEDPHTPRERRKGRMT